MKIEDYGTIENIVCLECYNEAMQKAWEDGPPEWLSKDDQGDLVILDSTGWIEWKSKITKQPCFVINMVYDFGGEKLMELCPKHLYLLANLVVKNE